MKKILAIMLMAGLAAPVYGAGFARNETPVFAAQQQSKTQQSQQQSPPKKQSTIKKTIDNLKKTRDQRRQDNQTPKTHMGVRG